MATDPHAIPLQATGLAPPARSLERALATAARTLHLRGHVNSLAGQVTAIDRSRGEVIAPPLHLTFEELLPEHFIRVDDDFRSLVPEQIPNPATRFHLHVYRARPDIACIVHTHSPHAAALAMLGRTLEVAHMDACMFHDDVAQLRDWPGVPVADEEGRLISEALGTKRAVLLANHGALVVGADVEEATYLAVMLEEAARLQLLAQGVGELRPIDPALAREAHDFLLQPTIVRLSFEAYARRVERAFPDFPTEG